MFQIQIFLGGCDISDYRREEEEFYGSPEPDEWEEVPEPTEMEMEIYASMEPDPLLSRKPYENHCWNCKNPIHSEFCKRDPVQEYGYICNNCGKSLRELKEGNK
jgi:hypothetical protein